VPFETILGQKIGRDTLVGVVDADVQGQSHRRVDWSDGSPFVAAVLFVVPRSKILRSPEPSPASGLFRRRPHIRIVLEVGVPLAERWALGIIS